MSWGTHILIIPGSLGEGQHTHEPGDSSDEGDEAGQTNADDEVEAVASESEYSEEETDEEVCFQYNLLLLLHQWNTTFLEWC